MKKNNMLRIASVLLVAVLLSTCAISGAFAKYTTSATASDEARVAKFNTSATLADLGAFSKTEGTEGAYTVSNTTSDEKGLVAPGTNGTAGSFTFAGTSEVAVEISYTGTVTLTGWEYTIPVEGEADKVVEYCPIIFTVNNKDMTIDKANNETVEVFAARVSEEIAKTAKVTVYAGATVPTNATQPSVSWRWAFDKDDQAPTFQNDNEDTKLGALGTAGVEITLTATIDQID